MEVHAVHTWFDRKKGVVAVEDDVQNVVRDIKAIDPRLCVYYNEQNEGFDIVEKCLDGNERLVFQTKELDARVVTRLHGADHWRGQDLPNHVLGDDEDYVTKIDAHNEEIERELDRKRDEQIAFAGESIAWALDLCKDRSSVGGSILVPRGV